VKTLCYLHLGYNVVPEKAVHVQLYFKYVCTPRYFWAPSKSTHTARREPRVAFLSQGTEGRYA
jgi:hypothetical protein